MSVFEGFMLTFTTMMFVIALIRLIVDIVIFLVKRK